MSLFFLVRDSACLVSAFSATSAAVAIFYIYTQAPFAAALPAVSSFHPLVVDAPLMWLQAMALDYSCPQEATFLLCHGPDNIMDDTGETRTGTRNSGSVEPYEALFKVAPAAKLQVDGPARRLHNNGTCRVGS